MLKIRLTRIGKSHSPIYRLVVAEKSRGVKREYIEILGVYDPCNKENKFSAKKERVNFWLGLGAQPSTTANNLLCDYDILPKNKKVKIVFAKSEKKKKTKESATIEEKKSVDQSESIEIEDNPKESGKEMAQELSETESDEEAKEKVISGAETTNQESS